MPKALVRASESVDLPTFGRPTMPHFKLIFGPQEMGAKCSHGPRRAGPAMRAGHGRSVEAEVAPHRWPDTQRGPSAGGDDRVHAERSPRRDAGIPAVGPQRMSPTSRAGYGGARIDVGDPGSAGRALNRREARPRRQACRSAGVCGRSPSSVQARQHDAVRPGNARCRPPRAGRPEPAVPACPARPG